MRIPEKWTGKIVFAVQAVLVLLYVLFTFWQDIREKESVPEEYSSRKRKRLYAIRRQNTGKKERI